HGTTIGGVRAFLAVPYAAPPVGELRFRAPRPHPGWDGEFDATARGASCPQVTEGVVSGFTVLPEPDEDCLTLDVWAPPDATDAPVMVWFHGGGFTSGSAHQPLYDGDLVAGEGVVLVSVNYRLGALGFAALDEAADGDAAVGNTGILDQRRALQWVHDNIAAFGGDPARVTIFGESAGGFSVCAHLGIDDEPGSLFTGAIIQSGAGCRQDGDPDEARAATAAWAASLGCATPTPLACLQQLDVDTLLAAADPPSGVVLDGKLLARNAHDRAVAGELTSVSIITGSNLDEWTLFSIGTPVEDEAGLVEALGPFAAARGLDPAEVAALAPGGSPKERFDTLVTDLVFACPALDFAAAVTAGGGTARHYEFRYTSADDPFGLGATHGSELVFLFGHPEGIRGLPTEISDADAAVGATLRHLWTSFATSGEPDAAVDWPVFDPAGSTTLVIDGPEPHLTGEIREGRCARLAALG
ncbi:MAG: hypothetical protein D6683_00635, partial [Actinomyces sp.]